MCMSWEWTGIWNFTRCWARESIGNFYKYLIKFQLKNQYFAEYSNRSHIVRWINFLVTFISTFGYLIGPHTNASFTIISQSGWTLIAAGFTVPTIPENIAFIFIGKDTIQSGTVCSWNCWLCFVIAHKNKQTNKSKIQWNLSFFFSSHLIKHWHIVNI